MAATATATNMATTKLTLLLVPSSLPSYFQGKTAAESSHALRRKISEDCLSCESCFGADSGNDAGDASIVCCHAAAHCNDAHDASDWLLSLLSPAAMMLMMLPMVCFLRCCPRQ